MDFEELRNLAESLMCHSHGYMCQDCPQPDQIQEVMDRIEKFIATLTNQDSKGDSHE